MSIITLTTDWGLKDYYAGAAKGVIYSEYPAVQVVDISHQVPVFDIIQAAFILKNACFTFPTGTVHVVEVKSYAGESPVHVVVEANGHFFIGADNGIFSLVLEKPYKVVEIDTRNNHTTFPTRDIYAKAACKLARDGRIEELGHARESLFERIALRPVVEESAIRGSIIYVDIYGNLVTNITEELFNEIGKGRRFKLFLRRSEYTITRLSWYYGEVPQGELLALFNSQGLLEISINEDRASSLLGLKDNDIIRIEFYDNQNR